VMPEGMRFKARNAVSMNLKVDRSNVSEDTITHYCGGRAMPAYSQNGYGPYTLLQPCGRVMCLFNKLSVLWTMHLSIVYSGFFLSFKANARV
jgi:hypothetical protein